jgi:hypothetical protein
MYEHFRKKRHSMQFTIEFMRWFFRLFHEIDFIGGGFNHKNAFIVAAQISWCYEETVTVW